MLNILPDEFAFNLSKNWHYCNGEDFTIYNGVSIGKAYEWTSLWSLFIPVMKAYLNKEDMKGALSGSMEGWRPSSKGLSKKLAEKYVTLISRGSSNKKKVLFSPYFSLNNVIIEWSKTRKFDLILSSVSPVIFKNISLLANPPKLLKLTQINNYIDCEFMSKFIAASNNDTYRKQFIYDGVDLFPLFEASITRIIVNDFPKIADECDMYLNAFKTNHIDMVVVPFDVTIKESLFIQIAKKLKLPTVTILHGFPVASNFNDTDNLQADYLFVYGKWLANRYGAKNKSIKIIETGNPKFDSIKKSNEAGDILVLTCPKIASSVVSSDDDSELYLCQVLEELKDENRPITIKLHPSESLTYYQKLVKSLSNKSIAVEKYGDIHNFIRNASVVYSPASTVLFEAYLSGKETHLIDVFKYKLDCPLFVGSKLLNLTKDEEEYYCGKVDGNSSKRVVSEIEKILFG